MALDEVRERGRGVVIFAHTVSIHNPAAMDGEEQPHAHIMFSKRELDGVESPKELFFRRANPEHPELGGANKSRE